MAGYSDFTKLGDTYKVRYSLPTNVLEVFRGNVRVAAIPANEVLMLTRFLSTSTTDEQTRASLVELDHFINLVEANALPPSKYRKDNYTMLQQLLPVVKSAYHFIVRRIESA